MIEILLQSGKWATVYQDVNLDTDGLVEIADNCGLQAGEPLTALMPDQTHVDCSQVVAIRFNK